jgi:hypothetical protein
MSRRRQSNIFPSDFRALIGDTFSPYHCKTHYYLKRSSEKERCQIMPQTGESAAIIMPTPIPIQNLDMLPASPGSFHLHHRSRNAAASSSKHTGSSSGKKQVRDMDGLPTSTGMAGARSRGGGNDRSRGRVTGHLVIIIITTTTTGITDIKNRGAFPAVLQQPDLPSTDSIIMGTSTIQPLSQTL